MANIKSIYGNDLTSPINYKKGYNKQEHFFDNTPIYRYTFNKVETINEKQTEITVSLGASGSYFLVDFALSEVIGE